MLVTSCSSSKSRCSCRQRSSMRSAPKARFMKAVLLASSISMPVSSADNSLPYPALSLVEGAFVTTAKQDFNGNTAAFHAATTWTSERLRENRGSVVGAPHLACAEYGGGREVMSILQEFLSVRIVVNNKDHGACFVATASPQDAARMLADPSQFGLHSVAPYPSALKVSPGLLDYGNSNVYEHGAGKVGASSRLSTTFGHAIRDATVHGLSVELSPGTLHAHDADDAHVFVDGLIEDLLSESIDLHATNFWSDPAMLEREHLSLPEGALRAREWSRAAKVVHELGEGGGPSPGDVCSWGSISVLHPADNVLVLSGLDHLLYSGRGVGGHGEEATELHMACFMGLLSFLASRPEVLRVSPMHKTRLLNGSARGTIQTGTATSTPLTDAGLDGTGEVIQVTDSGLDETSCFFANEEGGEIIPHGYYFDELGLAVTASSTGFSSSLSKVYWVFNGGDFAFDLDRRKVVQYINLVKSDSESGNYGESFLTSGGGIFPWLPADEFEDDDAAGHGTHTAGSAAGATLTDPATLVTCSATDDVVGCVGGCISESGFAVDDLVSSYAQLATTIDIDRLCPAFGCDDSPVCLSDDVADTLTDNGGMAQGAKLAIFDIFFMDQGYGFFAGNGMWEASLDTGAKLHSSSWGSESLCQVSGFDTLYDEFMYNNPENLLIFAAGNEGELRHTTRTSCTIGVPAIGKNSLAVGATSSGETRLGATGADGEAYDGTNGVANVDTVASFSSYGPTRDGRIKPEVVAPGDLVYSATSDGTDEHSCRLWAYAGTSMACPIVAGAAAMVRQYFVDETFYAADVKARGFCDGGFLCEGFSPSSATVKALLINSANLMGGSSEPDGFRGFGRVHLENGMPLNGNGSLALFVADSSVATVTENTRAEYVLDVDADAGLDLRATVSWIDPPASSFSQVQLINDLDLSMISPSGSRYTMWLDGEDDTANVNERVIVDAADVESGTWTIWVSANSLSTDEQDFSLVVTGAISPGTGEAANPEDVPEESGNVQSGARSAFTAASFRLSSVVTVVSSMLAAAAAFAG